MTLTPITSLTTITTDDNPRHKKLWQEATKHMTLTTITSLTTITTDDNPPAPKNDIV